MKSLYRSKFNFLKVLQNLRVILNQDLLPLSRHAVHAPKDFLAFFCCGTLPATLSLLLKKASVGFCTQLFVIMDMTHEV